MRVKVTKRAERRIEIVDRVWRNNRLHALRLFKEELVAAEIRLSEDPFAGKACVINGTQLRRLLLDGTARAFECDATDQDVFAVHEVSPD